MATPALTFDRVMSSFVLGDVVIGSHITASQLEHLSSATMEPMPDDPAWSFVRLDGRPVNAFVTFFNDVVHSGYFWIDVPHGGWEDHERAEQERRIGHERLMNEMFGSTAFEDDAMCVTLVRDPRSGLEQIRFRVG